MLNQKHVIVAGLIAFGVAGTACVPTPEINTLDFTQRFVDELRGVADPNQLIRVEYRQSTTQFGVPASQPNWTPLNATISNGSGNFTWSPSSNLALFPSQPSSSSIAIVTEFRLQACTLPAGTDCSPLVNPVPIPWGMVVPTQGSPINHASIEWVNTTAEFRLDKPPGKRPRYDLTLYVADGPDGNDQATGVLIDVANALGNWPQPFEPVFYWSDYAYCGFLHSSWPLPGGSLPRIEHGCAPEISVAAPFEPGGNPEFPFILGVAMLEQPGYIMVAGVAKNRGGFPDVDIEVDGLLSVPSHSVTITGF